MPQQDQSVDPLFLSFQLALAGRYSIDREVGRGGMGVVYLAREVHLDRPVAIKLLPPDRARDPSLRERFLREARLAAKLSHPNIIPIHSVDVVDQFVFYVMAYIDGETLAQRVRSRGPLAGGEGTRVLREAAWALAHAHSHGVVHRDVKPDNILLEGSGRALVADFGIAAAAGQVSADGVTGTPEFMSPEQALGKEIDARSDLYGLGATAFYAFSGRVPFEGASATEVLAKQVTEAPPSLAAMGLPIPRKVALLVDRCLAKDPHQRPASAEALAEQLSVALEQRREVPAVLRDFVKREGRVGGAGSMIYLAGLGVVVTGAGALFSILGTNEAQMIALAILSSVSVLALGLTSGPLAYLINRARRLLLMGFDHADLEPAFKAEIEQAREERAIGQKARAPFLEKALKYVSRFTGAAFVASIGASVGFGLSGMNAAFDLAMFSMGLAGGTAFLTTIGYIGLRERHVDFDTGVWAWIWKGRIGKTVFALARKLVGNRAVRVAMTHRATELSLGLAAESLFESLPKATRQALRDMPDILRRLQKDAQDLRRRHDELQEALAAAGDAAVTDAHEDLRAMRDEVHAQLGEAVGALETIRLNLLRLHAGSGSVENLTTHLGLAVEVSNHIERLLAARDEVERGLIFPREVASTPS